MGRGGVGSGGAMAKGGGRVRDALAGPGGKGAAFALCIIAAARGVHEIWKVAPPTFPPPPPCPLPPAPSPAPTPPAPPAPSPAPTPPAVALSYTSAGGLCWLRQCGADRDGSSSSAEKGAADPQRTGT